MSNKQDTKKIPKKRGNPTGKGGFQKGKSGNPAGRPKSPNPLTELLREKANEIITIEKKHGEGEPIEYIQMTRAEAMAMQLWNRACAGDQSATGMIFERLEPSKRLLEVSGKEGGPLTVQIASYAADDINEDSDK
jgi:hypothetical protein